MRIVTATEAKNRFGEYLESARDEPIMVRKNNRDYVVMMSHEDYERLQALEDAYWAARADVAAEGGWVGHDEAIKLFKERLSAA
jgi:antitoxin Phd